MLLQKCCGKYELLPRYTIYAFDDTFRPDCWSYLRLLKLIDIYNTSLFEQDIYSDKNDHVLEMPLLLK